jgi:hypothetical protein
MFGVLKVRGVEQSAKFGEVITPLCPRLSFGDWSGLHPILKLPTHKDDFGTPAMSIEPSKPSDRLLPPEPLLTSVANALAAVMASFDAAEA